MTLHRVLNLTLPDLNRTLELIQKQAQTTTTVAVAARTNSGFGGGGGGSSSAVAQGATGPAGTPGVDGISNLNLIVIDLIESEDMVMNGADVVSDNDGYAVTDVHTSWDIVTDELGAILTAE